MDERPPVGVNRRALAFLLRATRANSFPIPAMLVRPTRRASAAAIALLLTILPAACELRPGGGDAKQDTSTAPPRAAAPAAGGLAADTMRGVPAVPGDSAPAAAPDTGVLVVEPASPTRGGVLIARAPGLAMQSPRCSWRGRPVPCHADSAGVTAMIALSPEEPAGEATVTIDRPVGRLSRSVTVADRDFGREIVILDSARWALVRRGRDVARDARALRQILVAETPVARWRGQWREPLIGRGTGFGVDRIYVPAADSSRVIPLEGPAAAGALGTDTAASGRYPSWRHAGVDIAARAGTPVIAPAGAIVADAGEYVLTGRTIILDHGRGVMSAYFHLDTVLVRRGDEVRAGERIGRVGSTGLATGPHLHYGIYLHGQAVNPAAWASVTAAMRPKR